jgi:Zn-finger nucleic acid-binding protein
MSTSGICTACAKPVNPKSRYCPHCGRENRIADAAVDPFCPRCRIPLEPHDYRHNDAMLCPRCNGLWFDREEFNFLTSEREVYRDQALPKSFQRPALQTESGYLPCVRCQTPMLKKNFQRISGVMIDICGDHGIWLDAGEMENIRSFIANGGLDKSQDNRIERSNIELKELATRVHEVEFTQRVLHFFDFKYWLFKIF